MVDFIRRIIAFLTGHRTAFADPEQYIAQERVREAGQKEESAYIVDARKRCLAFLGPRHVLHPQYVCRGESYESFLRQPPGVLNQWRSIDPDPKKRNTIKLPHPVPVITKSERRKLTLKSV